MSKQVKMQFLTEQQYLDLEEKATIRHEYVHGHIFAMTGASEAHNLICGNIFSLLHTHLDESPCRAFINDMKVRLQSGRCFYYPDIMVTCEPFEAKSVYKSGPVLIIEVLSPATAQIDRREKLVAYKAIPTLVEYVIIWQDRQRVELYRRISDDQWDHIFLLGGDKLVLESLPGAPLSIPLATIYKGYNPPTRVKEEEGLYDLEPECGDLVDA